MIYSDDPPTFVSANKQPYTVTDGPIELRNEPSTLTSAADPTDRHLDSVQEYPSADRRALEHSHNRLESSRERSHASHASQPVQNLPQFDTDSAEATYDWPHLDGPSPYRIGSSSLQSPLVNVAYVRAHLSLLSEFKKLHITIEHNEHLHLPQLAKDLNQSQRWCWFVNLAVDRFHKWAEIMHNANGSRNWDAEFIPPLDVLMVWHAYMLNPIWYAEDCQRIPLMQTFQEMGDKLLPTVMNPGDISSFQPSHRLASFWLAETHTKFDPIEAAAETTHRTIKCSQCLAPVEVPYLTTAGNGYAQHSFSILCPTCNHAIAKESLALTKFVKDLIAGPVVSSAEVPMPVNCLAGTLHSHTDMNNTHGAAEIKRELLQLTIFRRRGPDTDDDWRRRIQNTLGYSIKNVPRTLYHFTSRDVSHKRAINRVLNAYTDDRPFSVDLVGAIIRQGSFIDKMYEFGWTEPAFYQDESEQIVLDHAITRYHAFLDLISTSATPLYVPTLDIDLVWHSHQLMAKQYGTDCKAYVGRYIDHDDKIEENYLDDSLTATCRAWEKRFGIAYMHCGCPPPDGTHSVGQYLRRLVAGRKQVIETRKDLVVLDRPDAYSATHPSLHNAARVQGSGHRAARLVLLREHAAVKRQKRIGKERKQDDKMVRDGSMSEAVYASRIAHDAYLAPIPFYRPAAACVVVGAPIGADAGNAAQCAVGAAACGVGNNGPTVGLVACGSVSSQSMGDSGSTRHVGGSGPTRHVGGSGPTRHVNGAGGKARAGRARGRGTSSGFSVGLFGGSGVACGGGTGASGYAGSGGGCGGASGGGRCGGSGGGGGCGGGGGGGGGGGCGGGGGGCGGGGG